MTVCCFICAVTACHLWAAALCKVTSKSPLQRGSVLSLHLTDCMFGSPEWTQGSKCSASRRSQTELRLLKHNHSSFIGRMSPHNNTALLHRERMLCLWRFSVVQVIGISSKINTTGPVEEQLMMKPLGWLRNVVQTTKQILLNLNYRVQ